MTADDWEVLTQYPPDWLIIGMIVIAVIVVWRTRGGR